MWARGGGREGENLQQFRGKSGKVIGKSRRSARLVASVLELIIQGEDCSLANERRVAKRGEGVEYVSRKLRELSFTVRRMLEGRVSSRQILRDGTTTKVSCQGSFFHRGRR